MSSPTTELIQAIAAVQKRANNHRETTIAQVTDPRPDKFAIRLLGYSHPVRAIASDMFDLIPIQAGDLVVASPIPGGGWAAVCRVAGSEPELEIEVDQIQAAVPIVGESLTEEGDLNPLIQVWRSGSLTFPGGDSTRTWTYQKPYHVKPFVAAIIEGSNSNRVNISVQACNRDDVVFAIRNDEGVTFSPGAYSPPGAQGGVRVSYPFNNTGGPLPISATVSIVHGDFVEFVLLGASCYTGSAGGYAVSVTFDGKVEVTSNMFLNAVSHHTQFPGVAFTILNKAPGDYTLQLTTNGTTDVNDKFTMAVRDYPSSIAHPGSPGGGAFTPPSLSSATPISGRIVAIAIGEI